MTGIPLPIAAANVAFVVVFSAFVVALGALIVITLRWAVRRDRKGRAEWLRRRSAPEDQGLHDPFDPAPPADPTASARRRPPGGRPAPERPDGGDP